MHIQCFQGISLARYFLFKRLTVHHRAHTYRQSVTHNLQNLHFFGLSQTQAFRRNIQATSHKEKQDFPAKIQGKCAIRPRFWDAVSDLMWDQESIAVLNGCTRRQRERNRMREHVVRTSLQKNVVKKKGARRRISNFWLLFTSAQLACGS